MNFASILVTVHQREMFFFLFVGNKQIHSTGQSRGNGMQRAVVDNGILFCIGNLIKVYWDKHKLTKDEVPIRTCRKKILET